MKWSGVYIAGLHGNEQLPVKALTDMGRDFILGNPKAFEKNVRYLDEDLNAAFGSNSNTVESVRARELLEKIPVNSEVVDFHTTTAETRPFVIVVDETMLSFARKTGVEDVVIMTHNIKGGLALINHRNGISIELGRHNDMDAGYSLVQTIVKRLEVGGEEAENFRVYEVYDVISEPGDYTNFTQHSDGFIPILAGEQSYIARGIYGLKARAR